MKKGIRNRQSRGDRPGQVNDRKSAFTLVEVMVSMAVLAVMMMLIAQIIGTTQRSWRSAASRLSQFREARIAFDTITRNLRQATLNPYRDFHYANGKGINKNVPPANQPTEPPDGFVKISELAYISGKASTLVNNAGFVSGHAVFFQAPLGVTGTTAYENLEHLLCTRGYFVQFGPDTPYLPSGLRDRLIPSSRFRLMEYQPPAENNSIYEGNNSWYTVNESYLRPVSDKIVALVISPRYAAGSESVIVNGASVKPTAIAPKYEYDSRQAPSGIQHELPPVVRVCMVALDENSITAMLQKLGGGSGGGLNVIQSAGVSFDNADTYESDMDRVKTFLAGLDLNYRIFETYVSLPASGL